MNTSRLHQHLLALTLCLSSTLVLAAPPEDRERNAGHQRPQPHQAQSQRQSAPIASPHNGREQTPSRQRDDRTRPVDRQARHAAPPADLRPLERTLRQHRQLIGRGPALPAHVHIARGRPLPKGYGRQLPPATLARLPHYHGYEWRRVGSDMVLVAVATGIVYALFAGVLN